MVGNLTAPIPYHGGKRRAAPIIWGRFGRARSYVEPFGGTLAVMLASPYGAAPREIVNDIDGFICNMWRALKWSPDATAEAADWPTIHPDFTARQRYILDKKEGLAERLFADHRYHDPEVAGVLHLGDVQQHRYEDRWRGAARQHPAPH